jgi:hypothetical protein
LAHAATEIKHLAVERKTVAFEQSVAPEEGKEAKSELIANDATIVLEVVALVVVGKRLLSRLALSRHGGKML